MDLDKSLDAILASKPKPNRRNKTAKPATTAGVSKKQATKPAGKQQQQQQQNTGKRGHQQQGGPAKGALAAAAAALARAPKQTSKKIMIHGLPEDITELQVKQYLAARVGNVHRVDFSYNAKGRPQGIATVSFKNSGAAMTAVQSLHGKLIDDRAARKVMLKVELVHEVPEPGLEERLHSAPAQQQRGGRNTANGGSGNNSRGGQQQGQKKKTTKQVGAVAVKPTKLKKAGPGRVKRVAKTAAELDAEMTDYFDKKTA